MAIQQPQASQAAPTIPTVTSVGKPPPIKQQGLPSDEIIPGISLTSNPDEPKPWERPPEFVTYKDAAGYIIREMMQPESYKFLMGLLRDGVPVEVVSEMIVKAGMFKGKYNSDLMLLIIEPIMLTLIVMADDAGIDYVMEIDDDEIDDVAMTRMLNKVSAKNITNSEDMKKDISNKMPVTKPTDKVDANAAAAKVKATTGSDISSLIPRM